jgi:glycosyltransferase involved in cell wall biosynthesis
MTRVSVVIPTYNCARFLRQALKSVLSQTYTSYEIIVVDDGSTDDTRDVVAEFGDRLRYLYQPNGGLSSARNLALMNARGEFIAYLDADDAWYPEKLDRQVSFLDAHKECGLVHSDVTIVDDSGSVIYERFNEETRRRVPEGYCTVDLLQRCHIFVPTVLERRCYIEQVGYFDTRLKTVQDHLRWIMLSSSGSAIGYIPEPLAIYRRTANSLSSSPRRVLEDWLIMFESLAGSRCLVERAGRDAAGIVRRQLYTVRRELAYLDRLDGLKGSSARHIVSLIREWPLRAELYTDLLKACAPARMMSAMRMLRCTNVASTGQGDVTWIRK